MATTYTRYLRLRIDDDLTESAVYNLERIDQLGEALTPRSSSSEFSLRSAGGISLEPNSVDAGGSGDGGTINLGTVNQVADLIYLYSDDTRVEGDLSLHDVATGGTKYLHLRYDSSLTGGVDVVDSRTLSIDMQGGNRQLVLGANLRVDAATVIGAGLTTSGSSLSISAPIPTSWTLPASVGTAEQVLSTDGAGTLSWRTVSGGGSSARDLSATWAPGDGSTKLVTHNWGTRKITVEVVDASDEYTTIDTLDVDRPNDSQVRLQASSAPGGNWVIFLREIVN